MTRTVYIGVGSNIEPGKNLTKALLLLMEQVTVTGISTFYTTKPLGNRKQPDFLNGIWRIATGFDAIHLKQHVLGDIESALGRVHTDDKYASRPIDLDILLYGDYIINDYGLSVPDPDIYTRPFVAVPLLELAPELEIPGTKKSLQEIVDSMNESGMKKNPSITKLLRRLI